MRCLLHRTDAFVTFDDPSAAERAYSELQGADLLGNKSARAVTHPELYSVHSASALGSSMHTTLSYTLTHASPLRCCVAWQNQH